MNSKRLLTTILFVISVISLSYSQETNCKVLKPEIAAKYTGNCKKGLANGKGVAVGIDKYEGTFKDGLPSGRGIYQYANGDIYDGEFKNGMKDGTGKFTFKSLGKDSTYQGIWKEDVLLKKITPPKYTITRSLNIQRYTIQRINNGNSVMFSFMQNGMHNYSVANLSFAESNGRPISLGQDQGFDNINFPFTCKVDFISSNKLRTATYEVILEIQINEPGQWLVTIHN